MDFHVLHGKKKISLYDYISSYMSENPNCEIHIGCDSQNHQLHTVYATAVVFRFPGNGAHVIYKKERVPKILDLWTKLWGELERSVELANNIKANCGIQVYQIDLDFNEDPAYPSNKLLVAAKGYVHSLGYKAKAKPHLLIAAWIADVLCH